MASTPDTPYFDLDFPRSLERPTTAAGFRVQCRDFQVDERAGFEPSGEGEHLLLHVSKENENTRWLARLLAEHYGVEEGAVGYCGLKDRRALTRQWFSVHLPGQVDTDPIPAGPGFQVLAATRHGRKLRRGMHDGNDFIIRLRGLRGDSDDMERRLAVIRERGVPNYFGEQRFGIDGGNLAEVARIVARPRPRFKGRRGGLYLSAARSWLFNLVLADRVRQGIWNSCLEGEARPEGPLWGRGRSPALAAVADYESDLLAPWRAWCHALEHSGLGQERRPLVLMPEELRWQWQGHDLELAFGLPPGTYATALLREVALLKAPEPVV